MSPKATSAKNKKESKDSKRPDSPIATGSAPVPRTDAPSASGEGTTRKGSVYKVDTSIKESKKDTYFPSEFDMESVDDVKETLIDDVEVEDDEFAQEVIKFSEYFHPLTRMMIKVFIKNKQVTAIPTLLRNVVDRKQDRFMKLGALSHVISKTIDKELKRIGLVYSDGAMEMAFTTEEYDYGNELDIRIDSFDKETTDEFFLTSENYEELFVMAYEATRTVTLHVHVDRLCADWMNLKTIKQNVEVKEEGMPAVQLKREELKHEAPITFRGIPIDMDGFTHGNNKGDEGRLLNEVVGEEMPTVVAGFENRRPHRNQFTPRMSSTSKHSRSPISIYDDDDFFVQDIQYIVPFAQESIKTRVADLQSTAMTTIPDVSSIPKLLKSHNVAYKKEENVSTWYQRFNNFCAMIGIYLPPPKAMEKNGIMGKEWDNHALPKVLYSRLAKMEKVLSHILFSPEFFPKDFQDDLQLNPNPYNFLRLFMALNSHAVPDLSDRVIKRPGVMKSSQSLSQYALSWVNYFSDEANVNGVRYSKFRQYCYFIDGLPQKYSILRKFLGLEFDNNHDRVDNIPISLELRNLPSTIQSLAQVHGISLAAGSISHIHQVSDDDKVNCDEQDQCDQINLMDQGKQRQSSKKTKPISSPSPVQCWLCDGPHGFRQCNELNRMKSVCIKRPNVLKHFQQMLLDKNSQAI
jgi:hypothetical protein